MAADQPAAVRLLAVAATGCSAAPYTTTGDTTAYFALAELDRRSKR